MKLNSSQKRCRNKNEIYKNNLRDFMKRSLAGLLAICLVFASYPVQAYANLEETSAVGDSPVQTNADSIEEIQPPTDNDIDTQTESEYEEEDGQPASTEDETTTQAIKENEETIDQAEQETEEGTEQTVIEDEDTKAESDGETIAEPPVSEGDAAIVPSDVEKKDPQQQVDEVNTLLTRSVSSIMAEGNFPSGGSVTGFTANNSSTYNIYIEFIVSGLDNPDVAITIPKGIELVNWTKEEEVRTRGGALRDSISKTGNGSTENTVLTYKFESGTFHLGINISLKPTYAVKDSTAYNVLAQLISKSSVEVSTSYSVVMLNSTMNNLITMYSSTNAKTFYGTITDWNISPTVYFRKNQVYPNHYPYNSITAVVPIPSGAEPGYLSGNTFTKLTQGVKRTFTNGDVTYYASWKTYDKTVSNEEPVLVYQLEKNHPLVSGTSITTNYYIYNDSMGGIIYRYPKDIITTKLGTGSTGIFKPSAYGTGTVNFDNSESKPFTCSSIYQTTFNLTSYNVSSNFYLSAGLFNDQVTIAEDTVYNIKDNARYTSYLTNTTGVEATNIKVKYVFDADFYAYKIVANLSNVSSSQYPSEAIISYKTKSGTKQTTLTYGNNTLVIGDTDIAITEMEVTYNRLSSGYSYNLLSAYLVNTGKLEKEKRTITGQIASAAVLAGLPDEKTAIGEQTKISNPYTLDVIKEDENDPYIGLAASFSNTRITPPMANRVYNVEDNARYTSSIKNRSKVEVRNIKVEYGMDADFFADRIVANLMTSSPIYPSKATITYKTKLNGTPTTIELTPEKKELKLVNEKDAITWMEVTYDKVGTGGIYEVLYIYMVNHGKLQKTERNISGCILSGVPAAALPDGRTSIGTYYPIDRTYTLDIYELKDYFLLSAALSNDKVALAAGSVYNIKDNARYASSIKNMVGIEIKDVAVVYDIEPEFYANRIVANVSSVTSSLYPGKATIEYKTNLGGDIKTAELIPGRNELKLEEEGVGITWLKVTYDKIGTGSIYRVLDIYVANQENLQSTSKNIKGQILSAVPTDTLPDGNNTIEEQTQISNAYTLAAYKIAAPTISLSETTLEKGKSFALTFQSSGTSKVYVDNPVYYILMPRGYIIGSYTSGYSGVPYSITYNTDTIIKVDSSESVALGNNGSGIYYVPEGEYVQYTISYTGTNLSSDTKHKINFTVGPEVDTAVYNKNLYLPPLFLAAHDNSGFPYDNSVYGATVAEKKIMGLANTEDKVIVRSANRPVAEIQKGVGLSILSFITSEYGEGGQEESKDYLYGTSGTYEHYIYNGLGSTQSVRNIEVVIALPRKGDSFTVGSSNAYQNDWDAVLTGAPICKGGAFDTATVLYSEDGGISYWNQTNSYEKVTHVKVVTEEGQELRSNETGKISLPFAAVFEETVISESKAYMNAETYYMLQGEINTSLMVTTPSTLNAIAIPVSGYVYKDYDGDLLHDTDGGSYEVTLFSGAYASGQGELSEKATVVTDAATGFCTIDDTIFTPGDYTLRVEKASDETFWWNNWSEPIWEIEGNFAYHTFQITGEQSNINWEIYIVKPRTLNLTGYTSGDYLSETDDYKITAVADPILSGGETATFVSLNPDAVVIGEYGNLEYVDEGDAVITVRVPQLPAFADSFGPWVEKEINVKARRTNNNITLYTEKGYMEGLKKQSDGVFSTTYKAGNTYILPEPRIIFGEETYYFAGWYDNEERTGTRIQELTGEDYGDKEYWAKWMAYEVVYEISPNNWEYSSFITAVEQVCDKGQIKFLADYHLTSDVAIEKAMVLKTDGDVKKVQCEQYRFLIMGDGDLTIDDGKLTLTGTNDHGILYVSDSTAQAAIYNGTVANTGIGHAISVSGILRLSGAPKIIGKSDIYLFEDGILDIVGDLTYASSYSVKVDDAYHGKILSTVSEKDASGYFSSADIGYRIGYGSKKTLELQRIITVTPDSDQSKIYGEAESDLTYKLSEPVTVSGQLGRAEGEDVGTYEYTLGTLQTEENYYLLLITDDEEFTINKKIIMVKPVDMERKVGEANPAFCLEQLSNTDTGVRVQLKSFFRLGSDAAGTQDEIGTEITGMPVFTCDAMVESPAGKYPITIESFTDSNSNYLIDYKGERSIGTLTVSQDSIVEGDYYIEPDGYVLGTWVNESIRVIPQGAYTKIRTIEPETGKKGEWLDRLIITDEEVMQVFELMTETGAYTKTLEKAVSLKSDTIAPYISDLEKNTDADTGIETVTMLLSDDLSGIDKKQIFLRQGEEDIPFQLKKVETGYVLSFSGENPDGYELEFKDMAGNVGNASIGVEVRATANKATQQERKLDEVPKTGQNSNGGTPEIPAVIMWNNAKGRKVCSKKKTKE